VNEESPVTELRALHRDGEYEQVIAALESCAEELQPEQALLLALSWLMTGEGEKAGALIGRVVELEPENNDWRSDLALASLMTGNVARAEEELAAVLSGGEPCAVDFGRMAAIRLTRGELEEAASLYQEAVDREPGREQWHSNLAGMLVRQQRLDEALEHYDRALGINPELQQAVQARQQLLVALDRTAELVVDLEARLADDVENVPLRLQLARVLNQDGRFTDAVKCLGDAIRKPAEMQDLKEEGAEGYEQLHRDQLALRTLQAELWTKRGNHQLALKLYRRIEKLEPEDPLPVRIAQANAMIEMGNYDEAETLLDELADENDEQNRVRLARSSLLTESGRYQEAETLLRELLEEYPGNSNVLTTLGQTLLWVGKLDEAAECFEQASEINPMALASLVKARKMPEDPAAIERMEQIAENRVMKNEPRATMSFALAELHDKAGDYEKAFHFLEMGNKLVDAELNYNPMGFTRRVDANSRIFTREYFEQLPGIRNSDRVPVFVVGMPRSGTTLTEQILCSHPQVFGAGELDLLPTLTRLIPRVLETRTPYPGAMLHMTPELREEAARYYLYGLMQYDEEHPFVVDKMPHNFMNLGLIAAVLPLARIIHIQRDPRDNALSNFQQNFKAKAGGMGFAFDMENIALQINDYHRMMNHWRQVLPLPIFELSYEELVEDQEGMTRQLLDFVGVEWDESVRDFHKTERAVRTASVSQVRQPIYKSSKQKWRRYEEQLQPLLDKLDPEVLAPWK
jgi:tetratricopeptide (TPR) repeat protein